MKKFFLLPLIALSFGFTTFKHGKIKKSAPTVTPSAGIFLFSSSSNISTTGLGVSSGHADEVEINSWSGAEVMPTATGPSGTTLPSGRPQIADLIMDKFSDKTSTKLRTAILGGNAISNIELRVYNGTATAPVYKIVITNALILSMTSEVQPCASGTCTEVHEVVSVHAGGTITWTMVIGTGPAQVVSYNIQTNVVS